MSQDLVRLRGASIVLPGREREFRLLLPAAFTYSVSLGMITVLVPLFGNFLGAREAVVGILVAIPGLLQVVMRTPSAVLSAAFGKRTMFVVSFLCAVFAGLVFAVVPHYSWFVLPQLLFGAASASFWPSQWAYASELCYEDRRSAALGYTSAIVGLGSLVGPYLGGYLSDIMGPRRAFLVYAVVGAVGLGISLALPAEGRRPAKRPSVAEVFGGALSAGSRVMLNRQVFLAVACMFLAAVTWGLNNAFYALHVRSIGYTATVGGTLLAVHGATSALTRIGFGSFARRRSLHRYLFGGTFLNALGMFAMPFFKATYALGAVTFVSGMGFGMMYPAAVTLIAEHTEGDDRVLGMGVFGTSMSLGLLASPLALGLVAQLAGIGHAFQVGNLAVMLGVTVLFVIHRRRAAEASRLHLL
ncbi:MAG: MFS transporter [Bacillota bacterium]